MKGDNIDLFNEYTGKIFATLYSNFPVCTVIKENDVTGLDLDFENEDDEFFAQLTKEEKQKQEVCKATFIWLLESGYVRLQHEQYGALSFGKFSSSTLTPKALEALNTSPKSLNGDTIGEQLKKSVKDGATESTKELVKSAFTAALGLFTT